MCSTRCIQICSRMAPGGDICNIAEKANEGTRSNSENQGAARRGKQVSVFMYVV